MLVAAGWLKIWTFGLALTLVCLAQDTDSGRIKLQHLPRGVLLPVVLAWRGRSSSLEKRGRMDSVGLGDYLDVSYSVLVEIEGISTPVVIDTGSSDLWVVGQSCKAGCDTRLPPYPLSTVNSTGLDVSLLYGDSGTGTYAHGVIGKGDVSLAKLQVPSQQFALINRTNAAVIESGASGIFGLGFPVNSVLWNAIFVDQYLDTNLISREPGITLTPWRTSRNRQNLPFPKLGFRQSLFPDLSFFDSDTMHTDHPSARAVESLSDKVFRSYSVIAPFLGRLIAMNEIDPMFAITLQRDTVEIGGNVGQLSIGGLPPGVQNDSLTWVPVRGYTRKQGGLPAPTDFPDETYPIAWEIPIDDVFLDGVVLPRSNLSSSRISLSALIDTGNSLIRGPEDVISEIDHRLGVSFPCSEAHTLAFSIGGKLFPIDPRDFVFQEYTNSVERCTANVVATDPPAVGGYLFSWSLGTPFLKSVLSAYYFGDLQHPSRDHPRIGLVSMVPSDAGQKLQAAVNVANAGDGNFPFSSEPAPTETESSTTTNARIPASTEGGGPPADQTSEALKTKGYHWISRSITQGLLMYLLLPWDLAGP